MIIIKRVVQLTLCFFGYISIGGPIKPREIASQFYEQSQHIVSNGTVKRLLKELGYSYRRMSKTLATGIYAQKDHQFRIITNIILAMSLQSHKYRLQKKRTFRESLP